MKQRTDEGNARKARLSKCWQIVLATLSGVSKLPVPSSPFDETLFAVSNFVQATWASGSLLWSTLSSLPHLSLPTAHNCASVALLWHPLDIWSDETLLSVQVLCMEPQNQNPLPCQTSSPPCAFARSSGCISDLPAKPQERFTMSKDYINELCQKISPVTVNACSISLLISYSLCGLWKAGWANQH